MFQAQLHGREWAFGPAQNDNHTVFVFGPVPLPRGPGFVPQAVGNESMEVAIEIRLNLAVLADGLLDPGHPGVVVDSRGPGADSISSVVTETHEIQTLRRGVGSGLGPWAGLGEGFKSHILRSPRRKSLGLRLIGEGVDDSMIGPPHNEAA